MINENLKIRSDSVNTYSSSRTQSPAMRGLVYGVLLAFAIWTSAASLVLMLMYHVNGRPLQVTLADPASRAGD